LYQNLCKDYESTSQHPKYNQLIEVFEHLKQAAQVDHMPWQLSLFSAPERVDIRAVHGNFIFVWSGFLDVVLDDDEMAALLADELAHVLARHTVPVEYTIWTEVFFQAAELSTTIAVMALSHGMVAIGGSGWMKWVYTEAADLDPLDRVYSEADEREAAHLALLIIARSEYSPAAALSFWQRVERNEDLANETRHLQGKLSAQQRVALWRELLPEIQRQSGLVGDQKGPEFPLDPYL
jgi:predicted Zn-dependent protease